METKSVKKSKRALVKELKYAENLFGPNHLNTANALKELAMYLSSQNLDKPQHPDAEPLCRRMVQIIEKNCGDDSMEFSDATKLHADLLVHAGQLEEAASVAFQSWQVSRTHLGDEHKDTLFKKSMFMEFIVGIENSGRSCMINLNSSFSQTDSISTTDCGIIDLHTAIWALRTVLGNSRSSMLSRDIDEFIKFTGAYLLWPTTALEILLSQISLDEEKQNEIRKIGFQEMCLRFEGDFITPVETATYKATREMAERKDQTLARVLKASLVLLEQQVTKIIDPVMINVRMLQNLLGLSETDCVLLNFTGHMLQSRHAHMLAAMIPSRSYDDAIHSLASALGTDEKETAHSLKSSGLLSEYRLIEICRDPKELEDMLTIPVNIQECLNESHDNIYQMMLHFVSPAKTTGLTACDYPHLEADHLILSRFLNGSHEQQAKCVNIMFYGEPGTGKTEFAKVLASDAGFTLYEIASANKAGNSLNRMERLASLRIAQRFLSKDSKALLLFDEVEDVFPDSNNPFETHSQRNPTHYGKAWMNHLLENNRVPVIWVSNSIEQIDRAYLRRFSYHMEFRKPPLKVRKDIAEKYLQHTSVSQSFIGQVAQNSSLTPALIESTARFVSLSGEIDSNEAERLVSKLIQQSQSAMGVNANSDCRISPTGYRLDYLNVDSRHPIEQIAKSLKQNPSATMCFYGLPGTGKTALAEHLAGELGRPLLAKRASDIISKWLGESEKNIADMFREAESEGAILFLDEADTFLRNRETATKSWEVSQVNELLQQMERFNGIFICATNLFTDLDAAALRRFMFKISFKAMTPAQREKMFVQEALLGDAIMLDEATRRRLHRLDSLVPGDFAVVKRQSRMMGDVPTPNDFLAELEAECRLKPNKQSRTIGFAA